MAWPFDNQVDSVLPIDYGVQKLANYANDAIGNNQNIRKYPDRKLQTWPRYDRNNTSALLPNNQNISGQLRGYNNYDGAQEYDEDYGKSFAGLGRFNPRNLMRPDNLTQDLGASTVQAPNTLDPNWQHQLRMQEINRGNINNRGFNFPNFGITGILKGLKDQFKYRGATEEAWDPNTGQFISAEEQDKQNALGGYYSDAARHQRRQRARVINMMKRRDAEKGYSKTNLQKLIDLGYGPQETITTTTVGDNINQGGGGGSEAAFTQTSPGGISQATSRAARGGMGGWRLAQGGRAGYREGLFVDEDVNIEGPGFDINENVMMASDDNNTRILENLFEKYLELGFSPQDAEIKAMEEFELMSQGPEQDQGLASLV